MKNLKSLGKRGIALFLSLVMCLSMVNLTALAADGDATDIEATDGVAIEYEEVFTCGQEEGHEHGEECYAIVTEDPEDSEKTEEAQIQSTENQNKEPSDGDDDQTLDNPKAETPETDETDTDEVKAAAAEGTNTEGNVSQGSEQHIQNDEGETGETPNMQADDIGSDDTGSGEITITANAPLETPAPAEGAEPRRVLICGLDPDHVHDLGCTEFPELAAGLQDLGNRFGQFQWNFFDALTGEEEDPMGDFAVAAAAQFGEEFNALLAMYHGISLRFAEEEDYVSMTGALQMLADNMDGDLNSGITLLAEATVSNGSLADVKTAIGQGKNVKVTTKSITISSGEQTLDLKGKTVTGDGVGSVFVVTGGKFTLSDSVGTGKITGGKGTHYDEDECNEKGDTTATAGGGVLVKAGTFIMEGGTISGNEANRGGGICVAKGATLNVYGGTISGNTAKGAGFGSGAGNYGGGGIFTNGTTVIDPTVKKTTISITGNTSEAKYDLGGGGIYVNSNFGKLTLINAVITNNTAAGLGGGMATCVHGKIAEANIEGAAIYGNHVMTDQNGNAVAFGNLPHHGTQWIDASEMWAPAAGDNTNAQAFRAAAVDILSSGNKNKPDSSEDGTKGSHPGGTIISDKMLGGGLHGWTGCTVTGATATPDPVAPGNNGMIYGGYAMALTAANSPSAPIVGYKVDISGNYSASQGGGVACNGIVVLGRASETEHVYVVDGIVPLTVNKTLTGAALANNNFTFQLLASDEKTVVDTASTNGKGSVTLNYGKGIDQTKALNTSYTFYIVEVNNDNRVVENATKYKVTVNVMEKTTAKTEDVVFTDHGKQASSMTLITHHYTPSVSVEKVAGTGSVNGNTVSFTNTWKTGSLTINKTVVSPTPLLSGEKFTFEITLKDETGNGIKFENAKDLGFTKNTDGTWTKTVTIEGIDLKEGEDGKLTGSKSSAKIEGIPAGLTYTVTEKDADKWVVVGKNDSGTISGDKTAEITNTLKTVNLQLTKTVSRDEAKSEAYERNDTFTFDVVLEYPNGVKVERTSEKGDAVVVTYGENDNTATIAVNVPLGTTYTITETSKYDGFTGVTYSGYAGTQNGYVYSGTIAVTKDNEQPKPITFTADNRYFETKKDASFSVTKTWDDEGEMADGRDVVLPKTVMVQLLQDGQKYGDPVALNAKWEANWTNLPHWASEGSEFVYSVKEVSIDYGTLDESNTLKADDRAKNSNIIRVRDTAHVTDKGVYEIVGGWLVSGEGSGENGHATLNNKWLGADEAIAAEFTIVKRDSDETLRNLPIKGVTFTLTKEPDGAADTENVDRELTTGDNGTISFVGLTQGTYTLKETDVPDAYDANGNKDRTWTIEVNKGNALTKVEEIDKEAGPVGNNTWGWDAVNAVADSNWVPSTDGLSGTLTVYNQIITGDLSITKVLDLDGVVAGTAAAAGSQKFTFEITATDDVLGYEALEPVVLEVEAGKTATAKGLRYGTYKIVETGDTDLTYYEWKSIGFDGANGTAIEDEDGKVIGYTVSIDKQQEAAFAVKATNSYERDLGSVSLSKTVSGNRGDQTREWNFEVELTAPASYVKLDGTYNVAIANKVGNETVPAETIEVTLEGTDTVDGKEVRVAAITLKHGQTATIEGLPVGTTYKVTEVEANTDGYSTTAKNDEGTITTEAGEVAAFENYNNYSRRLTVRKVWVGDGAIERPASVTVGLYRNGNLSETVELNAGNNWRYSWTELSESARWSVEELDVPANYTSEVTQQGATFTVTNTYDEPEIPDEDVPLTDIPDDDVPLSDLPDEDVPLSELPDDEVPLAEIPDEEVPLAEVPQTGESMYGWYLATLVAAAGFVSLQIIMRKKHEDEAA